MCVPDATCTLARPEIIQQIKLILHSIHLCFVAKQPLHDVRAKRAHCTLSVGGLVAIAGDFVQQQQQTVAGGRILQTNFDIVSAAASLF